MPYDPIERWEWEGGAVVPSEDSAELSAEEPRNRLEEGASSAMTDPLRPAAPSASSAIFRSLPSR